MQNKNYGGWSHLKCHVVLKREIKHFCTQICVAFPWSPANWYTATWQIYLKPAPKHESKPERLQTARTFTRFTAVLSHDGIIIRIQIILIKRIMIIIKRIIIIKVIIIRQKNYGRITYVEHGYTPYINLYYKGRITTWHVLFRVTIL